MVDMRPLARLLKPMMTSTSRPSIWNASAGTRSSEVAPWLPKRSFCCFSLSRRSEEHTSELQSLMRTSYAVFCVKKKNRISRPQDTEFSRDNNDPEVSSHSANHHFASYIYRTLTNLRTERSSS